MIISVYKVGFEGRIRIRIGFEDQIWICIGFEGLIWIRIGFEGLIWIRIGFEGRIRIHIPGANSANNGNDQPFFKKERSKVLDPDLVLTSGSGFKIPYY